MKLAIPMQAEIEYCTAATRREGDKIMRARWFVLAAGLAMATAVTTAPARADPLWSGSGYYIADHFMDEVALYRGPYSNLSDCEAARADFEQFEKQGGALGQQVELDCTYYASDPTPDDE